MNKFIIVLLCCLALVGFTRHKGHHTMPLPSECLYPEQSLEPTEVTINWEDKTSDAFWEPRGFEVWDGTKWASVAAFNEEVALSIISTWRLGYRPDSIRVTFTGVTNPTILLVDDYERDIVFESTLSGQTKTISFYAEPDADILYLSIYAPEPQDTFYVTKIEFGFVDPEECHGGGHGGRHEHYRNMLLEYDDDDIAELIAHFLRALR